MSLLTDDFFVDVFRAVQPYMVIDDTTTAYIRYLLEPLESIMKNLGNDYISMSRWMDQNVPDPLGTNAKMTGIGIMNEQGENFEHQGFPATDAFIYGVLRYMARELIDGGESIAMNQDRKEILPWDVRAGIPRNQILFGILTRIFTEIPDGVPIEVTINGQTFVHHMSYELAAGIVNFYYFSQIANAPLITVHGTPLRGNFNLSFDETDGTEYYKAAGEYEITFVGPRDIEFDNLEYLQGLQTAAQWAGVDLHDYVISLAQYDEKTGQTTALTF